MSVLTACKGASHVAALMRATGEIAMQYASWIANLIKFGGLALMEKSLRA